MLLRKVLKHIDLYYILTANNAVVTSQSRGVETMNEYEVLRCTSWGFARSLTPRNDALRKSPGNEVEIV